jgi:hypothetical protein
MHAKGLAEPASLDNATAVDPFAAYFEVMRTCAFQLSSAASQLIFFFLVFGVASFSRLSCSLFMDFRLPFLFDLECWKTLILSFLHQFFVW